MCQCLLKTQSDLLQETVVMHLLILEASLKKLTSPNTDGHLRRVTKELKPKAVICAAVAL
jgi:hypothetical protein